MRNKAFILFWLGMMLMQPCVAQEKTDIVKAYPQGKNIVVEYDLGADAEFVRLYVSLDGGVNYDQEVRDFTGKELFVKMTVSNGIAHLVDCFLANTYTMDSFEVPRGITINKPFTIGVNISYYEPWGDQDGPTGNVYVSLFKDGNEVATSD